MILAFVLIAGSIAAGAAVVMLLPLMRRRDDVRPAPVAAVVVMFGLLLGGGAMYALFSNYSWVSAPAVAGTPAASAARLARELAQKPDNLDGWLELGGRYFDLQQYPLAYRAFVRADTLAQNQNADAISGMAESLLAQDFDEIRDRAGKMFERVLAMQPNNPKAMLYSALAAMGRGEKALARERFNRMLAMNPREEVRTIIERQLQAIDASEVSEGAVAASDGARVDVQVRISPKLKYQLNANSALFVAARDPAQPGPPFAAKRLPVQFPVEVSLSAADAMMPSRRISAGQQLTIVARISINGQPTSASGDLFGQVGYHVGRDGKVSLVIDQAVP